MKKFFPFFKNSNNIYLDSAATAQKPQCVIDKMVRFYETEIANIYRGTYYLSQTATTMYENARIAVANYIGAKESEEIIFTSGATDSINLVANGIWFQKGNLIVTCKEHHSNYLPWKEMCKKRGMEFRVTNLPEKGMSVLDTIQACVDSKTKMICVTEISNVDGSVTDLNSIVDYAHKHNILVFVDGTQGIVHKKIDVKDIDVDFYCFSGHKIYGPTGIGVLYGKKSLLKQLQLIKYGGGMIERIDFNGNCDEYKSVPYCFETGTPPIVQAVGLHAALEFLQQKEFNELLRKERKLTQYACEKISEIEGCHILNLNTIQAPIISMVFDKLSPYDMGILLNRDNIAVRTGTHCASPYMNKLGIYGTLRVSMGLYNDESDIQILCDSLKKYISRYGK